jgi:hypothetical protein
MKTRDIIIGCLLLLFGAIVYAQTRADMKNQVRNLYGIITPRPGTIVVCVADRNCEALPDGAYVVYRTLPPAGPGACSTVGTGAFSVDEKGYMYWCSPPWDGPKGVNNSVWMRTAEPMVKTWTPDRPPDAPTVK